MALRVRLDTAEFGRMLVDLLDPVQAEIADRIAARARANAPTSSGEYRDRIGTERDVWRRGRLRFARRRVVARAPHSIVVEARTGNLKRAIGGGLL